MINRCLLEYVVVVITIAILILVAGTLGYWQFFQKLVMFWMLALTLILAMLTFARASSLGPIGSTGILLTMLGSWFWIRHFLQPETISAMPHGLVSFLNSIPDFLFLLFFLGTAMASWGFFEAFITGKPRHIE